MFEIFFVLSLYVALVWVIIHAALMLVRAEAEDDLRAPRGDPISTYIEENYGSHFQQDPGTPEQSLRKL